MRRFLTLVVVAMFLGVCYGLYHLSYQVQRLEMQVSDARGAIARERENIRVLDAEWAYLNRPDYLQQLADRFLPLAESNVTQVASMKSLPRRPVFAPDEIPLPPAMPAYVRARAGGGGIVYVAQAVGGVND